MEQLGVLHCPCASWKLHCSRGCSSSSFDGRSDSMLHKRRPLPTTVGAQLHGRLELQSSSPELCIQPILSQNWKFLNNNYGETQVHLWGELNPGQNPILDEKSPYHSDLGLQCLCKDQRNPSLDPVALSLGQENPILGHKNPTLDLENPALDQESPGLDQKTPRLDEKNPWHSKSREELQSLCDEGLLDMAMDALVCMEQNGQVPSEAMFQSLLKACSRRKALVHAKHAHSHLALHGLESTNFLGEYLVITLAKCNGGLEDAVQVFHKLPLRTVFSWTALISGYTDCGKGWEALKLYECMQKGNVLPNPYTFVSLLKACGSIPDLEEGKRIHAEALMYMCDSDPFVGACLVDMYARCRSFVDAESVFDGLSDRDVVSWTAMLSAYVEQGQAEKALHLYKQILDMSLSVDDRIFVGAIQACCTLTEKEEAFWTDGQGCKVTPLEIGHEIHTQVLIKGFDADIFICNSLLCMYSKCGYITEAENVFGRVLQCDTVSWNTMLSAYIEQGDGGKAIQLYRQMLEEGVSPNERTLVIATQACCLPTYLAKEICLEIGQTIHADAQLKGLDFDTFVCSSLVSMYGKCGSISHAQSAFDGLPQYDAVTWNAMLSALLEQGQARKTLQLYRKMLVESVSPSTQTFVIILQACCTLAENEEAIVVDGQWTKVTSLEVGQALHADARKKSFDLDLFVGSSLVVMYGKCGNILEAKNVFDELPQHDVVSWTAMLSAYIEQGQGEDALELYKKMQDGVTLDEITLVCVLQACKDVGSIEICRQIHTTVVSAAYDMSGLLANTLVHAYGNCASMSDAQAVFDALPCWNAVSWTALIAGYARKGNVVTSLQLFEDMQLASITPNTATFLSLLSACCQAGLVDKGVAYFESMGRDYGFTPEIEHYASVISLLGSIGDFRRAEDIMSRMPMQPDLGMWMCLLSACQKHGNVELGKKAFDHAVHLQPNQAAAFVLMSNIYADAGLMDCACELENLRHKCGWSLNEHEKGRMV